jgi:hypothetical protein
MGSAETFRGPRRVLTVRQRLGEEVRCPPMPSPVGHWPRLNNTTPSLQSYYRTFDTTIGCSVPVLGVGTLALAVEAACGFSPSRRRCGGAQILTFHMTD